jgi:predicted YcjX-like family ATPase
MIGQLLDGIVRSAENTAEGVSEALFEPVVRLGVTGLSRAGKTVFITSLVANLLDRDRMIGLSSGSRISSVVLRPQPDDLIPRFQYEQHLRDMTGADPKWPVSTRSISQLRLSFRVQPNGLLGGLRGPRKMHLDIVDYPGEWLLDLPLMSQSFEEWSKDALALARGGTRLKLASPWLKVISGTDANADLSEPQAQSLASEFTAYLKASRAAGLSACAPGRFLLPGDLEGSPALTFCPLEPVDRVKRRSLYRDFERRYEAYKSKVIKPFFTNHFSRIDRQIVLIDALGAIHSGPQAVHDLRTALEDILGCFRVGGNSWFTSLTGKRVERILFAASKADHLHHSQHMRLTEIVKSMVRQAKDNADFRGVDTKGMSLASLRATTETEITHDGEILSCVKGRLLDTGKEVAMFAGDMPKDPSEVLGPAAQGAQKWLNDDYSVMAFAPAANTLKPNSGPPHIRLDQAAEFLFGDKI